MNNLKNFKKSICMVLAMVMILAMTVVPAFGAQGVLSMLTLNSSDFTIVKQAGDSSFTITATGLDEFYGTAPVVSDNVSWSSSNSSVASVTQSGATTTVTIGSTDGRATLTASYSVPGVSSVTSNIVIERDNNPVTEVTGIELIVDFPNPHPNGDPTYTDVTEYSTTVAVTDNGSDLRYKADILKMDPTPMHAIATLVKDSKISSYVVDSEGGFLSSINGMGSYYDGEENKYYGWQYRVYRPDKNGVYQLIQESVSGGASILKLQNGDRVKWFWGEF